MAHPFRAIVFPLAAAVEMSHHPLARIVAQVAERFTRVAEIEIVAPAPQEGIEILHDFGRWLEAFLRPGFLSYRVPRLLQRLLGGHHIQVGFTASKQVAVVPGSEPEEVEGLRLI